MNRPKMRFNLMCEFESIDDLVEFYNRVRTDTPEAVGNPTIQLNTNPTAEAADFKSLADTAPAEEAPLPLEPVTPAEVYAPVQPVNQAKHTRDEVKAFCAVAHSEKGVNIKKILQSLGVSSFSALPDERLGDLYDAVKLARGD